MDIIASLSSGAVGGLLGGIGTLAKDIREAITGKEIDPALVAQIESKLKEMDNQVVMAQISVNLEEAKSEHLFVAGWRPACGWVCAASFAYAAILEPLMSWSARLYGSTAVFPKLDTTITMYVLGGMLGIGILRSVDKAQTPSPKGKE
jgi:hypothetical protein